MSIVKRIFRILTTAAIFILAGILLFQIIDRTFGPGDPFVPVGILTILIIGIAVYQMLVDVKKSLAELKAACVVIIQQERSAAEGQVDFYQHATLMTDAMSNLTDDVSKKRRGNSKKT